MAGERHRLTPRCSDCFGSCLPAKQHDAVKETLLRPPWLDFGLDGQACVLDYMLRLLRGTRVLGCFAI